MWKRGTEILPTRNGCSTPREQEWIAQVHRSGPPAVIISCRVLQNHCYPWDDDSKHLPCQQSFSHYLLTILYFLHVVTLVDLEIVLYIWASLKVQTSEIRFCSIQPCESGDNTGAKRNKTCHHSLLQPSSIAAASIPVSVLSNQWRQCCRLSAGVELDSGIIRHIANDDCQRYAA